MGLTETLETNVAKILKDVWEITNGQKIPDTTDLKLGNHGVKIEAAILYRIGRRLHSRVCSGGL
jgi:hypothetical protein